MNETKHELNREITSHLPKQRPDPHWILTCLVCFTRLDGAFSSLMSLCLIAGAAISQDVTASVCQVVAVMEGTADDECGLGGIRGFGWTNLQRQLRAASCQNT